MRRKNRKSRLRNLVFISLFCIIFVAFIGCGKKEDNIKTIEVPKNHILALNHYFNYSMGYTESGFFIYSDGGVYSFDFTESFRVHGEYSETDFMNKLEILMMYSNPIVVLDESDVERLYSMSSKLADNTELVTEPYANDAGYRTLSFYNGKKFIDCRQTGDYQGELSGNLEKELLKFYDKKIDNKNYKKIHDVIREKDNREQVYLYSNNDLYLYNIPCESLEGEQKYIVQNEEDCKKIKELTGINLYDYEWGSTFPDGPYVYLILINKVSNVKTNTNLVLYKDGDILFLQDSEKALTTDDFKDKEYYCYVVEYPKYILGYNLYDEKSKKYHFGDWVSP